MSQNCANADTHANETERRAAGSVDRRVSSQLPETGAGQRRRLVVKLSGEALGGAAGQGLDADVLARTARQVADAAAVADIALVIGAGNLFRGTELAAAGFDRLTADHMGMLGTVMNALAFRDALSRHGLRAHVLSSHAIATVVEGYSADRARRRLAADTVVLLAGGTGNPLFTTDTAACLRGIEIGAHLVVKATQVDGVYSADPLVDPNAERYDELTYAEVLEKRLRVMDLTAIALCQEHELPLLVCNVGETDALTKIAGGAKVGTRIAAGPTTP